MRCGTILLKPHTGTVYSSILYLLNTTHSKDVRFPWVTLYYTDTCCYPWLCHYMLFPTGVNGARLDGPKAPWQNKSASPRFSFECCPLICAILRAQCISVCPHGTTRLPLDGFSWNLTFELISKIYGENLTASVV